MAKAVVLLSGGLDSATCAAIARKKGYDILALTFDYGSRHAEEITYAKKIAGYFDALEHLIFPLALEKIGGSTLFDKEANIRTENPVNDIPDTYVPSRNIVFLSIALAYAEARDADAIFIGANTVDYSGYPDCRPEFLEAFRTMAFIGTKRGTDMRPIIIEAPLVLMSKGDIIKEGMKLGVPYNLTWTCYQGGEQACGKCDACRFRLKGFEEAGLDDPIEYE